jgi:hypothetical protein
MMMTKEKLEVGKWKKKMGLFDPTKRKMETSLSNVPRKWYAVLHLLLIASLFHSSFVYMSSLCHPLLCFLRLFPLAGW